MHNIDSLQSLNRYKNKIKYFLNKENINNNDFFDKTQKVILIFESEIQKQYNNFKSNVENPYIFDRKILFINFIRNIEKNQKQLVNIQLNFEKTIEVKITNLKQQKISKFKNLIIKIFTLGYLDKNKMINNEIKIINSKSKIILDKYKILNNFLNMQKNQCNYLNKNEISETKPLFIKQVNENELLNPILSVESESNSPSI